MLMSVEKSKETKKEYVINQDTMGISPFWNQNGFLYSKIIERNATVLVEKPPLKIMQDSCHHYGGSLEGKKEAARIILGRLCFAPIMLDSKLDLCFFPTESPDNKTCIWLSQPHIDNVEKIETKRSRIIFSNDKELPIESTLTSVKNKLHRAAQYRSVIKKRTKFREKDLITIT
jgi:competence protein ComK